MSTADADLTDRKSPSSLWHRLSPFLGGAALAALTVATAVLVLLGQGYRTAAPWTVDASGIRWIPGLADGLPYRPPHEVRPNALYDWKLAPPDKIQVYAYFPVTTDNPAVMTLLLPVVEGDAALFVNGISTDVLASTQHHYLTQPSSRPVISEIPASFLRPGRNRIDVIVSNPGRRSLSAPPLLGPSDALGALHRAIIGLIDGFRTCLLTLSLLAAVLALGAGAALRASTPWIPLAAAAAAAGVRTFASEGDLPERLGPFGPLVDQITLSAALICLGCAFLDPGLRRSTWARRFVAAGLALFLALVGLSGWGAYRGAQTLEAAGLALPLLGTAFLVWGCYDALKVRPPRSRRARVVEVWALATLALATISAVGVGSGLIWGLWVLGLETTYGVSVIGLLGTLAVVSALLAGQEIWRWAVNRPRLSRIILRQREEIEATALALRRQENRSAVLEERQRLSRDMHDGIGGQLMSLLARVRSRRITPDQLEDELASGLSELRLMVDSLDASDGSVADALAVLRSRIRTQTEAAEMVLEWSQAGDLSLVADDPRWILDLNRLIQEAATNAIRHSNADRIKVAFEETGDRQLTVTIEDNGVGFDTDRVQPGRGLSNLVFRAARLGGRLEIDRIGSGGTVVRAVVSRPKTPLQGDAEQDQSREDMIPS